MLTNVLETGINKLAGAFLPGDMFEYKDIVYIAVNMIEQDESINNTRFPKTNLYGVDLRDGRILEIDPSEIVRRIKKVKVYR